MNRLSYLFLAFSLLTFIGCDYVNVPSKPSVGPPSSTQQKKILLEKFTGQGCQGCPAGAIKAEELKDYYGDQLIVVAIHAGYFATVPGHSFLGYDFSTPSGEEYTLLNGARLGQYPSAHLNRREKGGSMVIEKDAWGSFIETIKEEPAHITMDLTTNFDATTRKLEIKVTSTAINAIQGTHNLVIYLTESEIIAPQVTYGDPIIDYNHQHMLRAVVNGTWGEALFSSTTGSGEVFETIHTYDIPAEWKPENMTVVSYIRSTDTEEILQAEEVHLK